MMVQLKLLDGGQTPVWRLDPDARQVGIAGVARARAALEAARPLTPDSGQRQAS